MLRNTKDLYGNHLTATDGDIGQVKDFCFDDEAWVIRYLVVNSGSWLAGRHVLISPHAFAKWDHSEKTLHLKLHKKQIEDSPSLESHKPVSRQFELEYHGYYGWKGYWNLHPMSGLNAYPEDEPVAKDAAANPHRHQRDDNHLRSTHEVTGYDIQASDGSIGHVSGFLVDDRSWAIRQLVVETCHWYTGKEILISPSKIERISYEDSKVFVNLTKADIQRTAENALAVAGAGNQRVADSTD
jgi:uncharacterized protein YrrD